MHNKIWILDPGTRQGVFLTGSVNTSHNGLENNVENMLRVTDQGIVNEAYEDFKVHWENSQPVGERELDLARSTKNDNEAERRNKNVDQPGRIRSVPAQRSALK